MAKKPRALNVLAVDDETNQRKDNKKVLEELGHKVTLAPSAEAAIRKLKSKGARYDVVITDLSMEEDMSGCEVAAAAKALKNPPRVILLSSYCRIEDYNFDARVPKPSINFSRPKDTSELKEMISRGLSEAFKKN